MIRCVWCGKEISAEERYKLVGGLAHVECDPHKDSQAGEPPIGDGCLRPASKEQENG